MAKAVKSKPAVYRTARASRPHKFTLLLTKLERESLERLAEREGLTASDTLRRMIREASSARAA
jgi:hypothetical protein